MILITGAAGFIGSAVAADLLTQGRDDLLLVDDFSRADKWPNYADKSVLGFVERDELFGWLERQNDPIECVIHLGARTDTTEFDQGIFDRLNLEYSKRLWQYCVRARVPMIYASSAATYGEGEQGFDDDLSRLDQLRPLNPYGQSKQDFDRWVLAQPETPPVWAGLKFFNVYGPNEYHKGRMASVIFHAFHQIQQTGEMKLFRSHRPEWKDGEQRRDFIYVKDVTAVIRYLMQGQAPSDIYNLGTGEARSFFDLTRSTFAALGREPQISFIDIPADIRARYQYFTEANMTKLRRAGYTAPFTSLEDGVTDYVQRYLKQGRHW
jgi:ADP-L-glycero-D-manno-heptose 6-epimerase